MEHTISPPVAEVFEGYPKPARTALLKIRQAIFETAIEIDPTLQFEETLKWGEPSYLMKGGSTIRLAWKNKQPNKVGIYFNCQTNLIETFKELHSDTFIFEGKRAILLDLDQEIPINALKNCILLALTYHARKHLPLLGA